MNLTHCAAVVLRTSGIDGHRSGIGCGRASLDFELGGSVAEADTGLRPLSRNQYMQCLIRCVSAETRILLSYSAAAAQVVAPLSSVLQRFETS